MAPCHQVDSYQCVEGRTLLPPITNRSDLSREKGRLCRRGGGTRSWRTGEFPNQSQEWGRGLFLEDQWGKEDFAKGIYWTYAVVSNILLAVFSTCSDKVIEHL
jgi:hypothetical protein